MPDLDAAAVMAWVARYERAWRAGDLDAVAELFTPDARYRTSPYADDLAGHEAIRGFWLDDEGTRFGMTARLIAVDGDRAVVRVDVDYTAPRQQQYRDLWVLEFAADGRVADYEEWAYWPTRGNTPD